MHKVWFGIVGAVSLTILLTGCGRGPMELPPPKPPIVEVCYPITKEVIDYEDFTGRTDAVDSVEVRAHRVTGRLKKVLFQDGALVKQGQPLFEIDADWYEAEKKRADALLKQSEAHRNRLEADYRRAATLRAQRVISPEDFDKVDGERKEAEAAVGVAKANVEMAALNLKHTTVVAPLTGRISRRYVDPGNLIKADDTVLTSIVALDPMYAIFDVDERTVLRLRRLAEEGKAASLEGGDGREVPVKIALSDEDAFRHEGKVTFLDNKVDPGTGTLRMRGTFRNPNNFFAPGLFLRVRLQIGAPHPAIVVPERALGTDQGQKFVYVVSDKDEVTQRPVKVGALSEGMRVVDAGLATNERIVVNGLQRVRGGAKVEPKLVDALSAAGQAPAPKQENKS